jgi:thiol-disulfide isomerase/thioredoxin
MRIAAAIFAFSAIVLGQDQKSVEDLLNKSAAVYKNLKGYRISAVNQVELAANGQVQFGETQLDLAALRPDKFRLLRKDGAGDLVCVNDGETIFMYLPKQKQYSQRSGATVGGDEEEQTAPDDDPVAAAQQLLITRFEGLGKLARYSHVGRDETLKVDGKKAECWVVEVNLPKSPPHEFWIDKSSYLVDRDVQLPSRTGNAVSAKVTLTLKKVEIDEPPNANLFEFAPPKNAKEVEMLDIPGVKRPILTGTHAADFKLKDLDGNEFTLAGARGKVVMLDFWATWCGPCRRELPSIEKIYQEYSKAGVIIAGVNDEDSGKVKGFVKQNKYSFPTLMDSSRKVHAAFRVRAIPSVLIIGPDGVIAKHFIGGRSETDLRAALDQALGRTR